MKADCHGEGAEGWEGGRDGPTQTGRERRMEEEAR